MFVPRLFPAVLSAALLLGAWTRAPAAVFQGVDLPASIQSEGKTLRLQGYGLRKKLVFSVYVGALYTTVPAADAVAAIKADQPKRISLTFLRNAGASDMREAFEDGFFKNAQERLSTLKTRLEAFLALAAVDVKKGQELAFTYLPGVGVKVSLAGSPRGVIEGRDFMEALWSVWLGYIPPSADLKRGMLGQAKP